MAATRHLQSKREDGEGAPHGSDEQAVVPALGAALEWTERGMDFSITKNELCVRPFQLECGRTPVQGSEDESQASKGIGALLCAPYLRYGCARENWQPGGSDGHHGPCQRADHDDLPAS